MMCPSTSARSSHIADWIASSRLWLVLDLTAAQPRTLPEVTQLCIAGGVDAVVLRIKHAPLETVRRYAVDVQEVCQYNHTPFIISAQLELALELGAQAVHLPADSEPLTELRKRAGQDVAFGCSTHSLPEARRRLAEGADYVFLGPVYPTPAKLQYGPPLGIQVVREAGELREQVVFIGGINQQNIAEIVAAGAQRVAAISALQSVADPQRAAARMATALKCATPSSASRKHH